MKKVAALILLLATSATLSLAARAVEITAFTAHCYGGSFEDTHTLSGFELADATSFGLLLDFDTEPDK